MGLLCPLGEVTGTFDYHCSKALLAGIYAPAAQSIVFSPAITMNEEGPLVLPLFAHSRHYNFLS